MRLASRPASPLQLPTPQELHQAGTSPARRNLRVVAHAVRQNPPKNMVDEAQKSQISQRVQDAIAALIVLSLDDIEEALGELETLQHHCPGDLHRIWTKAGAQIADRVLRAFKSTQQPTFTKDEHAAHLADIRACIDASRQKRKLDRKELLNEEIVAMRSVRDSATTSLTAANLLSKYIISMHRELRDFELYGTPDEVPADLDLIPIADLKTHLQNTRTRLNNNGVDRWGRLTTTVQDLTACLRIAQELQDLRDRVDAQEELIKDRLLRAPFAEHAALHAALSLLEGEAPDIKPLPEPRAVERLDTWALAMWLAERKDIIKRRFATQQLDVYLYESISTKFPAMTRFDVDTLTDVLTHYYQRQAVNSAKYTQTWLSSQLHHLF